MDQAPGNRIFLSAVTSEFGKARDDLAKYLISHGFEPVWQDVFPDHETADTLQRKLFELVAGCDGVICLIGKRSGSYPPPDIVRAIAAKPPNGTMVELPAEMQEASRTQWEFFYARALGKPIRLFRPGGDLKPEQEKPAGEDFPARQATYLAYLDRLDLSWAAFRSADHLCAEVAKIRWGFPRIRSGPKPIHPEFHSIGALFTGRDDFLDRIHASLTRPDRSALAIVSTVYGMGGIGKTRAAIEYAVRHAADYSALLFIRATDADALERGLAGLAATLDLPEAAAAEDAIKRQAVTRWLCEHPGWLLVLDNVDTPEVARRATALTRELRTGHILLTSRLEAEFEQGIATLELGLLTPDDAVDYLMKATDGRRRSEPDASAHARDLAGSLDCLTLALVHAGTYIAERRITFAAYLREWIANRDKVLDWAKEQVTGYPMSLAQTWLTSMQQLTEAGRTLLELLSFFSNEPVPESLLELPWSGAATAEGPDALADLQRFSLVTRDAAAERFTLHRIVRDVTTRRLATDLGAHKARLTQAASWMSAAFQGDPQDVRTWAVLDPLAPHAETLAWAADRAGVTEPTARLMSQLGTLFSTKARHAQAEPLKRRALAIDEASLGADHPDVAIRLNNLAQLLQATNRLAEAEPLMRRALAIDEASLGADHPDVAIDLNNLAQLLRATNRLAEAEPLMRRALAIGEASLGADHPNVATHLNNLALLLKATNRLAEAEPLYRRALAIHESSLGADHPSVAAHLNNLAQLLQATNRLAEVEPLMRRALAIDEASLGADHPNVAVRLNNLAQLLKATNRLADAEPLMRRHLVIFLAFQHNTGHAHPHRDAAIENYAGLLSEMGRGDAAVEAAILELHREAGLG